MALVVRRVDEGHARWLGLLQPVGLVVSPAALLRAQVVLDRNVLPAQQALAGVLAESASGEPLLLNFPGFAAAVLGWQATDLAGAAEGPAVPEGLELALPDYQDVLRPTYAVLDGMADNRVLMLVSVVEPHTDLDTPPRDNTTATCWHASPQARLERLLRATNVPAGLLCNGRELRLVYAPGGESSGHLGFPIAEMTTVAGREILAALHMLLGEHRVFSAPDGQRLLDLLAESRKYQNEVSNRLADQVLGALWELLRGFEAANAAAGGKVLGDLPQRDPQHIYGGLLTVIMRLVFLLYAEDEGLMPDSPIYANNYSVTGLYERLRADAGRYPDTLDQRYGGWAWLLATFRLIYGGGGHGEMRLPARRGQLFDPDAYPFLEGREADGPAPQHGRFDAPRVSDGVLWRVMQGLLVLDGERLSYRALDVEQVGSVYESMMGFDIQTVPGQALALRPKHIVIDLNELLQQKPGNRSKWLKEHAECDLPDKAAAELKAASIVEEAAAALQRRISPRTPQPLPPRALFLQPGEERRRSGSHYTPRELTEPIVRTTLAPILADLEPQPTPEAILALKVCDPAMGSGAFLVEACRQLAAHLVQAWSDHNAQPPIPADEDPLLHARRLVAQRCLYGVDRNPFAVNLAKLSLWLVTLARDHAFTFLDHALKHGDSLVGLTKQQIAAFHWDESKGRTLFSQNIRERIEAATQERRALMAMADEVPHEQKKQKLSSADQALDLVRQAGDLVVAAYFGADKAKHRADSLDDYATKLAAWLKKGDWDEHGKPLQTIRDNQRHGEKPVIPFHWQIEFPEVYDRDRPGFDAIVGNPPFMKGSSISGTFGNAYLDWLKTIHPESHGNADFVAQFYRRAFHLIRPAGTFGLIATNTIGQGDTRATGLRCICTHGGTIYHATKRLRWPGLAAVVVSVVHIRKERPKQIASDNGADGKAPRTLRRILDGREVPDITAFLFHAGGHDDPKRLAANAGMSFLGAKIYGNGFTFDDADSRGTASSLAEMQRLINKDPRNAERIFPYIGGQEINASPTQAHHRFVINFGEVSEADARKFPDLMSIVEAKVKPERLKLAENADGRRRKKFWWQWGRYPAALLRAISGRRRVLVNSHVSSRVQFAFLDPACVFAHTVNVFLIDTFSGFCTLQSQVHETWAQFFGSSMKDDLRYTPSDCFETFPFPPNPEGDAALEAAGQEYYEYRAELMVDNNEGLTKTYNRFHDPHERAPEIIRLRELHEQMDRAVLAAYGWKDIDTTPAFLLDYEIDEETWGTKKKPYRYRWPNEVHDEVLARLLALNKQRHAEEVAAGLQGGARKIAETSRKRARRKTPSADDRGPLF